MSRLSTIRKQIAALEAQAARITKEEMDSAIGKVKSLMSDFGLTVEHLTRSVTGKAASRKSASAPKKSATKRAPAAAKYADPKSGKTWSGFGRAPGWIAKAKSRDAFLVNKGAAPHQAATPVVSKKKAVAKKATKAALSSVKKATPAIAKKAAPVAKKLGASTKKRSVAAKKAAAPAKKVVSKKSVAKKGAAASAAPASSAAAPATE